MKKKSKKKVLLVSYHFPPYSGPGVFRSFYLVQSMLESQLEPIVLTRNKNNLIRDEEKLDNELLSELSSVKIIERVSDFGFPKIAKALIRLKIYRPFWMIFFPVLFELSTLWSLNAVFKGFQLFKKEKYDLIYTTSGPFSSLLTGFFLQKLTGKPWIADLRDPFTDSYSWQFPNKFYWKLTRKVEKVLFRLPNKLIVNTNSYKDLLEKRKVRDSNVFVVNNGF